MPGKALLEIDGVKYPNVYAVSYILYTEKDETGKPSDRARPGVIKITRESDDKTDICRWATDSSKPNFKPGKITFHHPDGHKMKTLEWGDGFITHYEEHLPHTKDRPDDQMYEYFEVSAREVNVEEAKIEGWQYE